MINKGRGQTCHLIINIKGGLKRSICQTDTARGVETRRGRVPTTHNALIYQKGEGVVHGRRPAGYRGGGRPIRSVLGRGRAPRLTKPPTGQEGRCQSQSQSNSAKQRGEKRRTRRASPAPRTPGKPGVRLLYRITSP